MWRWRNSSPLKVGFSQGKEGVCQRPGREHSTSQNSPTTRQGGAGSRTAPSSPEQSDHMWEGPRDSWNCCEQSLPSQEGSSRRVEYPGVVGKVVERLDLSVFGQTQRHLRGLFLWGEEHYSCLFSIRKGSTLLWSVGR